MIDKFFSLFSHDIGIDLGTANTIMLVVGKGIAVQEPSVVARHIRSGQIIAVGHEAKRMVGKTPQSIEVVRPLQDGVIADYDAAEAMMSYYIGLVHQGGSALLPRIPRPKVAVGVPSGITEVEARAVQDAAINAGARKAYLIEEPMATAIGAGLNVEEPEGRMVVDIGGGTTEIAVISLGGIVLNKSIRTAGDELDEAIITFARMKYNLVIGQPTAEEIKIQIGSAYEKPKKTKTKKTTKSKADKKDAGTDKADDKTEAQYVARGRDMATGLPKSIKFSRTEVREALAPVVRQIISGITDTLEETPPELLSDILEQGITLSGGTGQLQGLDQLIAEHTQMPVWQVEAPQLSVVRGTAIALENPKLLEMVKVVGGLR